MLLKMLKYDFRSSARLWIVSSVIITALTWISAACFRTIQNMTWFETESALYALALITIIFTFVGISIYIGGSVYVGVVRMYKCFFTDEGYLTFTLPVSRVTLFNSKLIHGISLSTASLLLVLLNLIGISAVIPSSKYGPSVLEEMLKSLELLFSEAGFPEILLILLIAIAIIANFIFFQMLIYTCVVIGCIVVQKRKVATSFGIYIAISTSASMIYSAVSAIVELSLPAVQPMLDEMSYGQTIAILNLIALSVAAVFVVLTAAAYSFSLGRLRRGLNLS